MSRSLSDVGRAWFSSGLDFRYEHLVGQVTCKVFRALSHARGERELPLRPFGRPGNAGALHLLVRCVARIQRSGGGTVCEPTMSASPVVTVCPSAHSMSTLVSAAGDQTGWSVNKYICAPAWSSSSRSNDGPLPPSMRLSTPMGPLSAHRLDWPQSQSWKCRASGDLGSAHVPREGVTFARCDMSASSIDDIRRELWSGALGASHVMST